MTKGIQFSLHFARPGLKVKLKQQAIVFNFVLQAVEIHLGLGVVKARIAAQRHLAAIDCQWSLPAEMHFAVPR